MKKKYSLHAAALALALLAIGARADSLALNSALVNSSAAGIVDPTAPGTPGLSGTLNSTSGLGTITFTDTKQGAGFFDLFVDLSLATPFFNEYGTTGGGAPAAGQSWQIDVPDYWCNTVACQALGLPAGSPDPNDPTANIIANTLANSLNNHNDVPGTLSNYLNNCGAEPNAVSPAQNPACNNDVSLAMAFNYFIPTGDREIVTLTVSHTAPAGGFYLEQLHPIDPDNPGGVSPVFLYGSARLEQTSSVPEPATLSMILLPALLIFAHFRRRRIALRRD